MKRTIICLLLALSLLLCLPAQAQSIYQLGDTIEDFSITTPQGEVVTLSGLLESHKAVLINFWFINCTWCDYEFPFLQQAYEKLGDDVAVLALTPYDSDDAIKAYQQEKALTFTMAQDTIGLSSLFGCQGFPTTVMIDRYGVYCFSESGAMPSASAFLRLMQPFAAEDYPTSLVGFEIPAAQPSAAMPASADMADAISDQAGFTFSAVPDTWPWLLSEEGHAYSSNAGEDSTTAALQADFTVNAGDVLAFDYRISNYENDDYLALYIDDMPVKVFSGEKGWQTYAVPFETAGEHTAVFAYMKNSMFSDGEDLACIDHVRILSGDEAASALSAVSLWPQVLEGTDVAYDVLNDGARKVLIEDVTGTLDAYYPGAQFFLVPGEEMSLRVRIGKLIDPEAAILYSFTDGAHQTLHTLSTDDEGFLVTLPTDSMATTGFPWNGLLLYPYFNDFETMLPLFYFATEEDLDYFCQNSIAENVTATWRYAADKAVYTLRFADQQGAPVAGVIANICDETTCSPMVSDENGVISFENVPYPYDIHVIRVPEGYTFDTAQGFTAPENGGEMQFTVMKN